VKAVVPGRGAQEGTCSEQWTRELAVEYAATVDRLRGGDYVTREEAVRPEGRDRGAGALLPALPAFRPAGRCNLLSIVGWASR